MEGHDQGFFGSVQVEMTSQRINDGVLDQWLETRASKMTA